MERSSFENNALSKAGRREETILPGDITSITPGFDLLRKTFQ